MTLKFYIKIFYVMGTALLGELACMQTGLVRTFKIIILGFSFFRFLYARRRRVVLCRALRLSVRHLTFCVHSITLIPFEIFS